MSGPAILAALVQQHAFEALYTREACRDLIEEYVRSGDGGCTTSLMKEACGLSALEEDNEDEAECHAFLILIPFSRHWILFDLCSTVSPAHLVVLYAV